MKPGATVLDLGSGTGKLLPYLIATGAETIAVEPVQAMRERLERDHPNSFTFSGSAEAIPLADGSLDAQAFHWFANVQTMAEIWRVLRTSGALGLIWNI